MQKGWKQDQIIREIFNSPIFRPFVDNMLFVCEILDYIV